MTEAGPSPELLALTREGELYEKLPEGAVRCHACAHECRIAEGKAGICRVRFNLGGTLRVPFGHVAGLQVDPIEKKPFYHVLPGRTALSFGMLGCCLRCRFCQNWSTSQAVKDPAAGSSVSGCSPADLVRLAREHGSPAIVSTYNEPLVTPEWATAVFREAKEAGLRCGFVSNGHATPEALRYLQPWVDFYNVDLKSFERETYRKVLGGKLDCVLRTIEELASMGIWIEIITLVVPGMNDSDKELGRIAGFIAGVSKDIPWHVTAYHRDYKMKGGPARTSAETLLRAAETGRAAGLRYVYAGNLAGRVEGWENTRCRSCGAALIERSGFSVASNSLKAGACPKCGTAVAGVWA